MKVTLKNLSFAAARTQRPIFKELFPDGAEVTFGNAKKASRAGLNLKCAAKQLMTPDQFDQFNAAAHGLLRGFLNLTAPTRRRLKTLEATPGNVAGRIEAEIAHEASKREHWASFLDGLAEAFVRELLQAA